LVKIETSAMLKLEARLSPQEIQAGQEKDKDLDEVTDAFLAGANRN
jgi:hypothetical protein